jgi:hypothetical protein
VAAAEAEAEAEGGTSLNARTSISRNKILFGVRRTARVNDAIAVQCQSRSHR